MAESNSFSSSPATSLFSTPSSSRDDSKTQEYPASDDFRQLLVQLSDELYDEANENQQKIRFLYKRKLGRGRDKMNMLQMLERLEEKGEFSAYNVEPLEELLRSVERHDLISEYVQPYRMKHTSQLTQAEDGKSSIICAIFKKTPL